MLIAVTRAVSPAINRCELGFIERREISLAKAAEQHRLYEACLAELGATAHSDDVDQSFRSHADQIGAKRRRALSV